MLVYALKSAFCLSLLYIPYMLLLSRESFFRFNRFMLLGILILSAILPLIDIHVMSFGNGQVIDNLTAVIEIGMPMAVTSTDNAGQSTTTALSSSWSLGELLTLIYLIGIILVFISKAISVINIYRAVTHGVLWKEKRKDATVYCHMCDITPFSVFKAIVISENDWLKHSREIMTHEMGHVKNRHSWDIVLLNIIQIIQWFNPLVWHLALSMRDIHEYEADDCVLQSGIDILEYKTLLIRKAVSSGSYTFANSFNHSLIKKRLTMMLREKSNRWMLSKALYVIPVALVALSAFATNEYESAFEDAKAVVTTDNKATDFLSTAQEKTGKTLLAAKENMSDITETGTSDIQTDKLSTPQANDGNKVYASVDELPYYLGGPKELMTYIRDNIRYPKTAMSCGISGRIIVQFVVDKDGSIKDAGVIRSLIDKCDVRKSVNQSTDNISAKTDVQATGTSSVTETEYAVAVKELEEEAMRVISEMKGWVPGKVKGTPVSTKFAMPITFKLK